MATPIIRVRGATSFDFYPYTRMGQGEGFDPIDGDKLRAEFGEAVGEGAPLLQLTADNREYVVPVHLNTTPASLAAFVRDINKTLAGASQVDWQDATSATTTILDALHCRFEPAYDYRRAQAGYLSGIVRLITKPYGHSGTSRVVATAAATGPFTMTLGAIDGDAPAQLELRLAQASVADAIGVRRFLGFAVIPSGYEPWWPAASITQEFAGIATMIGASGAAGSQAWEFTMASGANSPVRHFEVRLPSPGIYAGRNRVIALARVDGAPVTLQAANHEYIADYFSYHAAADSDLGPVATLGGASPLITTGSSWMAVDMGVLTVDPSSSATPMLRLGFTKTTGATSKVRIAGVILMPDESAMIAYDDYGTTPVNVNGNATYVLDDRTKRATRDDAQVAGSPRRENLYRRGRFPTATPGISARVVAFFMPSECGTSPGDPQNVPVTAELRVRERFHFYR